jgi:chemotaxis signal transduction protein
MANGYFSFIVAGQECAIDADKVLEIVDELNITDLPLSPGYFSGVANFRGEVVGVVDLARFLSQGLSQRDTKTIVCSSDEGPVALIVDSIKTTITPEIIKPVKGIGEEVTLPYLQGVVMAEKGLIRILDIVRMLKDINGGAIDGGKQATASSIQNTEKSGG